MPELIRIEGVSVKPLPGKPGSYTVRVFIKNVGDEISEINSVYVFNIYGNVYCADIFQLKLSPGEVNSITLECELEKMAQYFVKASTKKGYESLYSISL
ncbi:MAG: hypothetical protein QW039_01620 [Fervidicoccaceae archaeon]